MSIDDLGFEALDDVPVEMPGPEYDDNAEGRDWHCPDCRVLIKLGGNHCRGGKYGGCCRTFTSIDAFDRHHWYPAGKHTCLTDEQLRQWRGLDVNDIGYWRLAGPVQKRLEDDET